MLQRQEPERAKQAQPRKAKNRFTSEPRDAGFWLRLGARLIDQGLLAFLETALVGVGAYLNALGHPPWVIASGFVVSTLIWYVYLFEMTRRRGQTIGKWVANIRVVTAAGSPPVAAVMGKRLLVEFCFDMFGVVFMAAGWALARGVGFSMVAGAGVGLAVGSILGLADPVRVFFSRRKQALHDVAAGTFVLRLAAKPTRGFVFTCALAALVPFATTFGIVRPFFVEAYFVPSGSMKPTLRVGDRLLANKLVHRLRPPRRFEIVMFKAPEWVSARRQVFVKRVVGVSGDRLQVRDGKLLLNGKEASEPYLAEPPTYAWPLETGKDGTIVVPKDAFVVLGDNRNNSNDSHLWRRATDGGIRTEPAPFLPTETIRGKLVYRYWPPDRMGMVAQEEWSRR